LASNDIETVIRYDGTALAGHEIDVQELAPALLALADMIQLANRKFNGDATTMRVTVKADIEQQCFQLHIHIFQTLLQHAQHLFGTAEYKTAKELAEFLDLMLPKGLAGTVAGGVFWFFKKRAERERSGLSQTNLITEQHGGQTVINNFYGDGASLTMKTEVYELGTDPAIVELGKKVMKPLEQPGYDTLTFHEKATDKPVIQVTKEEASAFIESTPLLLPSAEAETSGDDERNPIRVTVFVKTQRNEGHAQWELKWGGRTEAVTMDAVEWLEKFQAGEVPHDLPLYLDVEIEVITSKTNPDAPARFHLKKVLGVVPSGQGKQESMFNGDAS
jgi:hypothetical protein